MSWLEKHMSSSGNSSWVDDRYVKKWRIQDVKSHSSTFFSNLLINFVSFQIAGNKLQI